MQGSVGREVETSDSSHPASGIVNGATTVERLAVPPKATQNFPVPQPFHSEACTWKNWPQVLNKHSCTNAHGSTIQDRQRVQTTPMSTKGWMDKQNVVQPHNGILRSHEKEWHSDTCYTLDEPQRHYTHSSRTLKSHIVGFYVQVSRRGRNWTGRFQELGAERTGATEEAWGFILEWWKGFGTTSWIY